MFQGQQDREELGAGAPSSSEYIKGTLKKASEDQQGAIQDKWTSPLLCSFWAKGAWVTSLPSSMAPPSSSERASGSLVVGVMGGV